MLRTLLSDRFGLKVHRETREVPVYALEVAKGGLKMKELPPDPALAPEHQGCREYVDDHPEYWRDL